MTKLSFSRTASFAVLLKLAVVAEAAETPNDQLPWRRPPGCNPATCTGCKEYRVSTDNFTDSSGADLLPADVCGSDGIYFPVPIEYFANCQKWFPYSWRCIPCCSAGCGKATCQWAGQGEYNTTHGCSACASGDAPRLPKLAASTCRSCFRSRQCFQDQPSLYRVCEARAPGQSLPQPPEQQQESTPPPAPQLAASPLADCDSLSPAAGEQPTQPAEAPATAAAPAPEAQAPAPEAEQAATVPGRAPGPQLEPLDSAKPATADAAELGAPVPARAAVPPSSAVAAGRQTVPLLVLLPGAAVSLCSYLLSP